MTVKRKGIYVALVALFLALALGAGAFLALRKEVRTMNPRGYATIGDIRPPHGYSRVDGGDPQFARFLRSLPLKARGEGIRLYSGGPARLQWLGYAVVDMPILSNDEQCADVCMRLRAEYLFRKGDFSKIAFQDVNGKTLSYRGGAERKSFEKYLRTLYGVASTYSLKRQLPVRNLADMQPGDVFVYAAGDHDLERRMKSRYGHAMMVADVAVDRHGRKVFILVEGNTPARDIHVVRNHKDPFRSPWFTLDIDAKALFLPFYYRPDELRHF